MSTNIIQWYPGHIAKAEKLLSESLHKVDLVIEVRDSRIPISTSHPHLSKWIQNKKHLLVINRKDMVHEKNIRAWKKWFDKHGQQTLWCNAKNGDGVSELKDASIALGKELNDRRKLRGMRTRAVRALLLGFPNVGKSALINRLTQKKVVSSSRRAGVTRSLRWVRIDPKIDLLDAPGVLPPFIEDQQAAIKLAICDDIGEGAYDVEQIAIALLQMINTLEQNNRQLLKESIEQRYRISFEESNNTPHTWLENAASLHTSKNIRRMSQRILDDFRKSLLGRITLDIPL